jgi:hypothetical protein
MPSADKAFALTVCNGMDVQTVWLDKQGTIHKEDPSKGKSVDHPPCAFAANGAAADTPEAFGFVIMPHIATQSEPRPQGIVSVGHGLAAPPPPAIGPPDFV